MFLKLFFSGFLCAHFTIFLYLRVLIVFAYRFNDKTATIFDVCGIERYLDFLCDVCCKVGVGTGCGQLLGRDEVPFVVGDFQGNLSINPCLDEFEGDRREVLYIRE